MKKSIQQTKAVLLAGLCAAAIMSSGAVIAGPDEDRVIDKVVDAYGGEAFANLRSVRVRDTNYTISVGQSPTPEEVEISTTVNEMVLDYAGQRKSLESWTKNRHGVFLNQQVFADGTVHNIDHRAGTIAANSNASFDQVAGGTVRVLDTTVAKVMLANREDAVYGGEFIYNNRPHERLTFPMASSPELTIAVDAETGLISRMTRGNPQVGTLYYIYTDHTVTDGIAFAKNSNFQVGGQPNSMVLGRSIEVNPSLNGVFDLPSDYDAPGAQLDTSEMTVEKIGDNIYYVGQGNARSVFIDAGDHYVASGGYSGLTARYEAVKAAAGNDKPLRYQIVTHHHSDHIGGMADAAALGASFVTVSAHKSVVQGQFAEPLPDDRFLLIEGSGSLAGGDVVVRDISTEHSSQYLLVYLPDVKMAFIADHFGTSQEEGLPAPTVHMAGLRRALDDLDLDIEAFLDAHGARRLTMAELRQVTEGFTLNECPGNRPICR